MKIGIDKSLYLFVSLNLDMNNVLLIFVTFNYIL